MARMKIGCHLSISKGYENMGREALSIDANCFQFFTRNPRGGKAKALIPGDMEKLIELMVENDFAPILAHAPYTLNPAAAKDHVREFALLVMKDDLQILEGVPGNYYNFHPGSHVGQGVEKGIDLIVAHLDEVLDPALRTTVLLETMAGKGSEIGRSFQEIREIIDRVKHPELLGVCLDSCHIYSAGYDIVNDLDGVITEFDKVIGLDRLKTLHLNDSMKPFASNLDRHARIGEGTIGKEALIRFINHPALRELPFYLETPNDNLSGYAEEIAMLREAYQG